MTRTLSRGFTLLEFMVTLLIASVLMVVVETPVTRFHQMVVQQQWESERQMDWERIEMMLKTDLLQAGYGIPLEQRTGTVQVTGDSVMFQADWNQDGDFLDTRESLIYRFDTARHTLFKKSGSGGFQPLLEEMESIVFEAVPLPEKSGFQPICLRIHSQASASQRPVTTVLCPLFL